MHLFYGSRLLRDDLLRFAVQRQLPEEKGGFNGPCIIIDSNIIIRTNRPTDIASELGIEPKSSSSINSKSHWAYGQLMREYRADPEKWKGVHRYGKRSLVETVFSMMKLRHGRSFSSRGGMERRRELLIKVVPYNIERFNFLECVRR